MSGNSICLKKVRKRQGKVREFYLSEECQGNVRQNACPCMRLRKFNGIFSKTFAYGRLSPFIPILMSQIWGWMYSISVLVR